MNKGSCHILISKIEHFVRKYYFNKLIQGALIGSLLWLMFFFLISTLEYFSWFSPQVRGLLFWFFIGTTIILALIYFFVPIYNLLRYRKRMPLKQAAIIIGRFFPEIEDRLLNTLQLHETLERDDDNELLIAAIDQRIETMRPIPFSDAVELRHNLRYLWCFLGVLVLAILLMIFIPELLVAPTQRIVNYHQHYDKPLPFEVSLPFTEAKVSQGSSLELEIKITGERIPDRFYVITERGSQLMSQRSNQCFYHIFKNTHRSFTFHIKGGDYISQELSVIVFPNPVLLSYECTLEYPRYTRRDNEKKQGTSRLIVPEGTHISYTFITRDTDSLLINVDTTTHSAIRENDNWHYDFKALTSQHFSVTAHNTMGGLTDPMPFSYEVIADRHPDIQVESQQEELSPWVFFSGIITDDYGFSRLLFKYSIDDYVRESMVLPLEPNTLRSSFYHTLHLDSISMLPGQQLTAYFEVWDNDGINGPKAKRSETMLFTKPSLQKLDSIAHANEDEILNRMAEKANESQSLKDQIDKILQELASKKELDWTDKEKVKDLLEKQQQIQEEWKALKEEQKQLNEFMKDNKLANEELLKKQEQINKLFEEVIPNDMKKMMEEIERLLGDMPREKMQNLMKDIQKNNNDMMNILDRNLSLLEQLKMEKDLNDFLDNLNNLGNKLDQEIGEDDYDDITSEDAKEEYDKLMQQLEEMQERNKNLTEPFNIEKDEQLDQEIQDHLDEAMQMEHKGEQQPSQQQKKSAGQKMKQMANQMQIQMQSSMMQQMAEDAHQLRILLENVVRSSHRQEELLITLGRVGIDDPSISEKIIQQKEILEHFAMTGDSLRAMALRQPMVQSYIFDELKSIDLQSGAALNSMTNLRLGAATASQQRALMAMNNLALLLAESLENIENSMQSMGDGNSQCQQNQSQSNSKPSQNMKNMQQMQEQLGQQLKELQQKMQQQKGDQPMHGISEELARMAAEQEMLRQGMKKLLDEMKSQGMTGDSGLNQIIKEMEQLEQDIVNKIINNKTIERSNNILSRMLESEKAQQEREKEEERKSTEYKGSDFDRKIQELHKHEQKKKNSEFLRKNPIEYTPFYKIKINEYYLRSNSKE